jgi:hypothetical protein
MEKKMFKSACDGMKKAMMVSILLITTGIFIEIITKFLVFSGIFPILVAYSGLYAVFLGIMGIVITLFITLIPRVNEQLKSCQH